MDPILNADDIKISPFEAEDESNAIFSTNKKLIDNTIEDGLELGLIAKSSEVGLLLKEDSPSKEKKDKKR